MAFLSFFFEFQAGILNSAKNEGMVSLERGGKENMGLEDNETNTPYDTRFWAEQWKRCVYSRMSVLKYNFTVFVLFIFKLVFMF